MVINLQEILCIRGYTRSLRINQGCNKIEIKKEKKERKKERGKNELVIQAIFFFIASSNFLSFTSKYKIKLKYEPVAQTNLIDRSARAAKLLLQIYWIKLEQAEEQAYAQETAGEAYWVMDQTLLININFIFRTRDHINTRGHILDLFQTYLFALNILMFKVSVQVQLLHY